MTYKTYLVGGAVRDIFMKRGGEIKDRDFVVVGATPEHLLSQGYEHVGKDFPVFLHPVTRDEYALARVERKIGEGYHGFACDVSGVSIEDDLKRRDLTMNAIAIDEDTGNVVDPFGGIQDIADRLIRHTSEAFSEDPLRVIRLARFAARFFDSGFSVAQETKELAKAMVHSGSLNSISNERFWLELEKAFSDHRPAEFIKSLAEFGVFQNVKYFAEMFGSPDAAHVENMAMAASAAKSAAGDAEAALCIFIALTAVQNSVLKHSRAMKLFEAEAIRTATDFTSAASLNSMLTKIRAWGQVHTTIVDFMLMLKALEKMNVTGSDSTNIVLASLQAGRKITADMFPELQGPALGKAMIAAREEAIALVL